MSKKAPFFSHDMNARHDPKISAMRGVFGAKGYGWFWILVEIMAESDGYQLDCKSKYTFGAYAMQMQCSADEAQEFVNACVNEFDLFESDGEYFWSNSLRKRMQYRDSVSEKRAAAAEARWEKQRKNANASKDDANAEQLNNKTMQNDANETKQNETLKHIVDSDECDRCFDEFWKAYPKRDGKAPALKKWKKFWKEKQLNFEDVMEGLERYIAFVKHERAVRKFDRPWLAGSTFVNQRQWESEWKIEIAQVKTSGKTPPQLPKVTVTEEDLNEHDKLMERIRERNQQQSRTVREYPNVSPNV